MIVEVISLLSSPDGKPSPPARTHAPTATARKSTPLSKKRPSPPRRALVYSDDAVDEDAADDNPLSRSTNKPSFAAFRTLSNISNAPAQPTIGSDDIWSLDDDDFLPLPDPKRPRLSSDNVDFTRQKSSLTRAKASTAYPVEPKQPKLPAAAGSKRQTSNLEQVEFTSPPRLGVKPAKGKVPFFDSNDEDDPFASPPPLGEIRNPPGPSNAARSVADDVEIDDDSDNNLFVSNVPKKTTKFHNPADMAAAWDPISSSAPLPSAPVDRLTKQHKPIQRSFSEIITLDDSDDEPAPHQESSDDEFPDINKLDVPNRLTSAPRWQDSARPQARPRPRPQTSTKPRAPPRAPSKTPATKRRTAEEVAREKEEKAAARVAREAEMERKRREKAEEKAREKEEKALERQRAAALAEVNKLRTDKKVSTPEMIVDLPDTLKDSTKLQAETFLKDLDVQADPWSSPVDNVVRWRRKVRCRYNEELGHWEPIPMRIEKENYAMVIMTAAELVQRALAAEGADLEAHVGSMQREFANHEIIYLIEGLTPWIRKNRNNRNRQFISAVQSTMPEEQPPSSTQPSSTQQRRRKKPTAPEEYVDEDRIEDALLQLQVLHGVLIHHVSAPIETARWIAVFTQHISTVPYRRQREESNAAAAAFCMEAGQVRTGDDTKDAYVKMLQEIGRVTAPIAYGIAAEFDSVTKLVRGFEEEGSLRLEAVRKSANKDGAVSDRAVGQAVSRRIYKIFTGEDATSTEV